MCGGLQKRDIIVGIGQRQSFLLCLRKQENIILVLALLAIWGIEIRAGKDIWGDMGDYWDYRATKKKPVIFGKKIQNRNGYPFFVLFLVKNNDFW